MTLRTSNILGKIICWTQIIGLAMFTLTFVPNGLAGVIPDGKDKQPKSRVASAASPHEDSLHKESDSIVINLSDITEPESRQLCPSSVIKEKKCKGNVTLTLNRDGTWNYSGSFPWSEQGSHMDFVLGVKDQKGTVIIFTASPLSTREGYIWDKQGNNHTVKDNWQSFAGHYHWYWKADVGIVYAHTAPSGGGIDLGSILKEVGTALGIAATAATVL